MIGALGGNGYSGLPSVAGLDESLSDVALRKKYPFELEKAIHNVKFIQHHTQRQDEFDAVSASTDCIKIYNVPYRTNAVFFKPFIQKTTTIKPMDKHLNIHHINTPPQQCKCGLLQVIPQWSGSHFFPPPVVPKPLQLYSHNVTTKTRLPHLLVETAVETLISLGRKLGQSNLTVRLTSAINSHPKPFGRQCTSNLLTKFTGLHSSSTP